jgi:hypothetical protein
MFSREPDLKSPSSVTEHLDRAWDDRIERLLEKLPRRLGSWMTWLRTPSRRWIRIAVALLFICGGLLFILPVLGLWMLPLGLALLAEDVPGIKAPLERIARKLSRLWRRLRGR